MDDMETLGRALAKLDDADYSPEYRRAAGWFADILAQKGLAIVPVVPTGAMVVAGGEAQSQSIGSYGEPRVVYDAMLAAGALSPTAEKGE